LPKLKSFEIGIAWGAGHGIGVGVSCPLTKNPLAVGYRKQVLAVVVFAIKDFTKIEFLDKYMDLAVGITIIIIGGVAIYEAKSFSKLHHHHHSIECSHTCEHPDTVLGSMHLPKDSQETESLCIEDGTECDTRSTSSGEPCCAASQALADAAA
ncbi:hypothetical protein FOZ63_019458, partial [Perkinsus olseni]